jgi:ferric-dicitrate binding protein FerR (iron transport regulator)
MNIDHIIHKFLLNKESVEEREILESWKTESNANLEALESIQTNWEQYELLKDYNNYDSSKAWNKVSQKIESPPASLLSLWLKVAAVFVLFCGSVYYLKMSNVTSSVGSKIILAQNAVIQHEFDDQSVIWLNSNSSIDYSQFSTTNRKIKFTEGEAYFKITSDSQHPFEIQLKDKLVKVIGTEFNIINTELGFRIDVVEGLVAISDGKRTVELSAGETLISDKISMSKAKSNSTNVISWKTKELVFSNSNVIELARDLSKYYQIEFKLENKVKEAPCLINTKFTDESIEEVINELKTVYGFVFNSDGKNYSIVKTNC